jgi:hypothetical protein
MTTQELLQLIFSIKNLSHKLDEELQNRKVHYALPDDYYMALDIIKDRINKL